MSSKLKHKIWERSENIEIRCVHESLVRHENYPYGKSKRSKYKQRPHSRVKEVIVHHTAGNVLTPPKGIVASNRYIVEDRGWPMLPYHFYVPHIPDLTDEGRYIVYRINPVELQTWHTKGANDKSIGVVCQGNFTLEGPSQAKQRDLDMFLHKDQPYLDQIDALYFLLEEYLFPELGLNWESVYGHNTYGKKACPGWALDKLIWKQKEGIDWPYEGR